MGQVRVIFSLRDSDSRSLFPPHNPPPPFLAYVDWYMPFQHANPNHGMYKVQRNLRDRVQIVTIVPLSAIHRSIQLYPDFESSTIAGWTSSNVLDICPRFFVNNYTDRHTHGTIR